MVPRARLEVLPGEPHFDPDARMRGRRQLGGHRVLKGAVQVRQTGVDEHDGHGVGNTLGVGNDLRVGVRRGGTHVHSTESNGAR